MKRTKHILPMIVFAQFCCTSLWFAGNGVMVDLLSTFNLESTALGDLTAAVQFGFIFGTLVFAFLMIADRFSPSTIFLVSAIISAAFNMGVTMASNDLTSLLFFRFMTGFALAGIYPVGMKIAADYFQKGLGRSLGFLVGALVVGTAFPHLLKWSTATLPWRTVIFWTSGLSILGGGVIFAFVPNGPFRKPSQRLDLSATAKVFKEAKFRSAALGYFGHMWELYAFWAFVPVMLTLYLTRHPEVYFNSSILSFLIIGLGGISCVVGAFVSEQKGVKLTATTFLFLSGLCCLVSPLFFIWANEFLFIGFLIFWGLVVIADSPLFSTLVAQNAPPELKGTALTIVNCIGFSITIISIQLISYLDRIIAPEYIYLVLGLGPLFGLIALIGRCRIN